MFNESKLATLQQEGELLAAASALAILGDGYANSHFNTVNYTNSTGGAESLVEGLLLRNLDSDSGQIG